MSQTSKSDSVLIEAEMGTLLSTKKFAPFYLHNNQFGEVSGDDPIFLKGKVSYKESINEAWSYSTGLSFRNDALSSLFLGLRFKDWEFKAGRVKTTYGGLHSGLSSGSLAMSENALPMPMLEISLNKYKSVPFTHGYLKLKGSLSQRWMEKDRYISRALLHGKSFYAMIDLDDLIGFQVSSGMVHFAQYGGVSPQGDRQPSNLNDYFKVFTGRGIHNPDGTTAGEGNAIGNHLGLTEIIFKKKLGEHILTLNYQKPFEDNGSIQLISFKDFLIGLEWDLSQRQSLVNKLYVEVVTTKWQSGRGLPDATDAIKTEEDNRNNKFGERDDIYNNYLYRTGWTYHGQVIGTPLILTHKYTLNFLTPYPDYETAIANNRLSALHLGIEGRFSSKITYKGLFTYTKNFGTYAGIYEGRFNWGGIDSNPNFEYVFLPARKQFYTSLEVNYAQAFNFKPLVLSARFASDFGEMYNALGLELSVLYRLLNY
ncbi:capsule assembly Wzi family protein [Roseivirga echinicomitans]